MPEILTESFCERCGTRYTFESAAPRKTRRLGQIKTLSKGMKNWVMSDDTSLDEAMAAARNDDDRELTSHQLDAFHATFNFCMTCRQYTCGNCWNTAEGRCLTCAPHLGQEILPAAFADQAPFEPVRIDAEAWPEAEAWPVADLSIPGLTTTANGNGNGLHAEPADAWASTGATDAEDVLDFDPAARLAFLSGETPLPIVEPEESPPAPEAVTSTPEAASSTAEVATPEPRAANAAAAGVEAAEAPTPEDHAEAPSGTLVAADTQAIDVPTPEVRMAEIPAAEPPAAPPIRAARPFGAPSFRWPTADEVGATDAVRAQAEHDGATAETIDNSRVDSPEQAAAIDAPDTVDDVAAASSKLEPAPPTVDTKADAGATRTADLLRRFRPGQNIDAELAAYEAEADRAEDVAATPHRATPDQPVVSRPEPLAAEPEPVAAEAVAPEIVAAVPEPVAAEALAPEAVAEPEPVAAEALASGSVAAEPEPVAAEAVAPEPVAAQPEPVAPQPEPVAAEPEPVAPQPEPVAADSQAPTTPAPTPTPVWPTAEPVATDQPREDRIEQPTWQIFAPEPSAPAARPVDGTVPPGAPPQPPFAAADPQWPVRPDQVESPAMALLANRKAGSPSDALWAASAQEVLARPASAPAAGPAGVQPCSSCGLSLSATARFCRRCGTRQA